MASGIINTNGKRKNNTMTNNKTNNPKQAHPEISESKLNGSAHPLKPTPFALPMVKGVHVPKSRAKILLVVSIIVIFIVASIALYLSRQKDTIVNDQTAPIESSETSESTSASPLPQEVAEEITNDQFNELVVQFNDARADEVAKLFVAVEAASIGTITYETDAAFYAQYILDNFAQFQEQIENIPLEESDFQSTEERLAYLETVKKQMQFIVDGNYEEAFKLREALHSSLNDSDTTE